MGVNVTKRARCPRFEFPPEACFDKGTCDVSHVPHLLEELCA